MQAGARTVTVHVLHSALVTSLSRSSETVYECPDYHTAGENSCFFNKNDTSIWVNYNITVVATNALGSNFSDPVDVDVVYIGEGTCASYLQLWNLTVWCLSRI